MTQRMGQGCRTEGGGSDSIGSRGLHTLGGKAGRGRHDLWIELAAEAVCLLAQPW